MKYVFAMIAGGLMITTSFLAGALAGGYFVYEVEKVGPKTELKEKPEE